MGTISGCYYAEGMQVFGDGMLAETDVNYTYTNIADKSQFDMLDNNWYQAEGLAPTLVIETGYSKQTFYDIFDGYVIDNGYLYIGSLDVTVDALIGGHEFENASLGAYAPDGTTLDDNKMVNTGDTFTMTWYGNSVSVKVVVVGDLLANGKVTSAGFEKLLLHVSGATTLKGAFKMAGDLDGDGQTNSADLLIYKQALLGLKNILA